MPRYGEWSRALRRSSSLRPWELVVLRSVHSTHDFARDCAGGVEELADDQGPVLFVAWEQTAGRGRHGRTWVSPAGAGVYVTVFARGPAGDLSALPLRVAVALGAWIGPWVGDRCQLKWPNDLLVGGRKIGGILIDAVHGRGAPWLFVSLGVNRDRPEVADGRLEPAGLAAECAAPPGLAEMTEGLALAALEALVVEADVAQVLDTYRRLSAHRPGESLCCRLADGVVEGRFRGFDDDGRLRLETGDGLVELSAGEVVAG